MSKSAYMWLGLGLALASAGAAAQTGTVPLDNGTPPSGLTNSSITELNGNVGVGTTNPTTPLQVAGSFSTVNYGTVPDWGGMVAAGTAAAPTATQSGTALVQITSVGYGATGWGASSAAKILMTAAENFSNTTGAAYMTFSTRASGNISPAAERMRIDQNGNVGIGTTSPGAAYKLDVNGTIHAATGVVFPDGITQTVAFNPANCGADYAESVDVSGDRTKYEPGDILVIDPDAPGKFLKSNQAYSTLVAGIYSTKPGFVGRLHPQDAETNKTEVPMAMVGRVPTKVSAENGPIKVGDLLVASSTMGYAMKGTDHSRLTGAVIGKALGSLDSGTGVIMVLVTLQ